MKVSTILKWISGGLEAFLGIPFLGGALILSLAWQPLLVMLALHIVTLVFIIKEGTGNRTGSILGIVTSCIGWIPFVGMVMHIITACLLLFDAAAESKKEKEAS